MFVARRGSVPVLNWRGYFMSVLMAGQAKGWNAGSSCGDGLGGVVPREMVVVFALYSRGRRGEGKKKSGVGVELPDTWYMGVSS